MEIVGQKQEVVSTKDWVLTILITAIPIISVIMLCVWAFGGGIPKSKSNWAKATLIWVGIGFVLMAIFYTTFIAIFATAMMSL